MPLARVQWLVRVKSVEREYGAVRIAVDYFLELSQQDPPDRQHLKLQDFHAAQAKLEGTYLVRLFAEFEACLRGYWSAAYGDPPARTRDLLDGIGARRNVPAGWQDDAHEVREFRNSLVHERAELAAALEMSSSRQRLCRFLSYLPLDW